MREIRDICAAYERLCERGRSGVLASVVFHSGSTYRRAGARMLLLSDDTLIGLIGGGCLEGDLLEQAKSVRETGAPRLVRYDSTRDDDIVWGLGLGCAGILHVLLERVGPQQAGPLALLAECARERTRGALATVVGGEELAERWALHADGRLEARASLGRDAEIEAALRAALDTGRPAWLETAGREIFVEPVLPPLRLVVFGAGPDAAPLVRIAGQLGWDVAVVDGRPAYARPERFPEARSVLQSDFERAVSAAGIDDQTYTLVMTHHYLHDRALLRQLLPSPARYIGMLGPKRRSQDLLRDLREEGLDASDEQRARLFGPAGLDIGAEGPEEIALALVGEIQAVAAGRSGGWLRERKGPIHDSRP